MSTDVDVFCASPLQRGTEFILDNNGNRLFGTCGPRALASALSSALGQTTTCLVVYLLMLTRGWCAQGGASTIGGLQLAALASNAKISSYRGFQLGWNYLSWLQWQVGHGNPAVIELSIGQKLIDLISGLGENAVNLQYHYIAVLGYNPGGYSALANRVLPPGFWCADGASFAGGNNNANGFNAANVLQYYPISILNDASPCAGLSLVGRQVQPVAWTKQANGNGLDDKGHTCGSGFMSLLESRNETQYDGLMSESPSLPDANKTSFLPLVNGDVYAWNHVTETGLAGQGAAMSVLLYNLWQSGNGGQIPQVYVESKAAIDAIAAAMKAGA